MRTIEDIRKDYPALLDGAYHYLDAAASSLTPVSVLDAVNEYYTTYRSNTHRALFTEAVVATERYEDTRRKIADFIGADTPNEIIVTSGATESSNMIAMMQMNAEELWGGKTNVVTTEMEHHSAYLPTRELTLRKKRELRTIKLSGLELDYAMADKLIDDGTAIVSVILASNVTGVVNDVRRIADVAHKHGAFVIVDATAALGHIPVDVKALGADALYFSGHKMFAPTGVGVLYVKMEHLEMIDPIVFGGHMIDRFEEGSPVWAPIPARFEAGTKNIGGVIGLGSAIDYINDIGIDNIHKHNSSLAMLAIEKLEAIEGVKAYSHRDATKNTGTVSFVCDFAHPHDIAEILARSRVAVRPGHHCAIPLHRALGLSATTRASFHVYNTKEDVLALIEGVKIVRSLFV